MDAQLKEPAMTPQQELYSGAKGTSFQIYKEFAVGSGSIAFLAAYELITLCLSGLPGLVGYASRSIVYPFLFCQCGSRPGIGRGVVLRNPKKISLGEKVLIDDYAVLDVRGDGGGIKLASHVSVGRFTTVAAKHGEIDLQGGVNIGSYCRIATNSSITIGESTLVAAYCYIGPGNHKEEEGKPLIASGMDIKGGVHIGKHCWIGAHTTILDGVSIGDGAIVGAHSMVKSDIPAGALAFGVPARVVGSEHK